MHNYCNQAWHAIIQGSLIASFHPCLVSVLLIGSLTKENFIISLHRYVHVVSSVELDQCHFFLMSCLEFLHDTNVYPGHTQRKHVVNISSATTKTVKLPQLAQRIMVKGYTKVVSWGGSSSPPGTLFGLMQL